MWLKVAVRYRGGILVTGCPGESETLGIAGVSRYPVLRPATVPLLTKRPPTVTGYKGSLSCVNTFDRVAKSTHSTFGSTEREKRRFPLSSRISDISSVTYPGAHAGAE